MQRLAWLALFSLLGISGLFAARTVAGVTVIKLSAPNTIAADVTDNGELPFPKRDRLPSPFLDRALPKAIVDTAKITPTKAPKQSEAARGEITSWHWHEGSKTVRHRTTAQAPAADSVISVNLA